MRNKILDVLLRYETDTTFLYQGGFGNRIYDGNAYLFILQKENQKDITIKFEPQFLPNDLEFVYSYLYGDRENEKNLHMRRNKELFEMFRNQVKDDTINYPPLPEFKATIKFIPPPRNKR
jgi:hypothetical protein